MTGNNTFQTTATWVNVDGHYLCFEIVGLEAGKIFQFKFNPRDIEDGPQNQALLANACVTDRFQVTAQPTADGGLEIISFDGPSQ